ncbi:MAG: 3-oxo-5-alpha-steroid 4-dehydrogenase [Pseudomonadota bacterium]
MPNLSLYQAVCLGLVIAGGLIFISLFFIAAPYGRHNREGWGRQMDERLGWMVMELVSPLMFLTFFWRGGEVQTVASLTLMVMFCGHYVYRALIYPLRIKARRKVPVATVLMACVFNLFNGSTNGWAAGHAMHLTPAWTSTPMFWAGIALFAFGMWLNLDSDAILRRLRKPGETGYKIPKGNGFRLVTSPNYLGEILEWTGFALAGCTWAGAAFAVFTFANLAPRAASHHRWYLEEFEDYPRSRRAIIPGVW